MTRRGMIDRLLSSQNVTRRDFMAGALASGLTVSAAGLLWSQRAAAASTEGGQPVRGGHLIAGLSGASTTDSMDQQTWTDVFMIAVGRSSRDSLVELGSDDSLHPALAESWEPVGDASTWRFTLRSGVEFSNGKSLTTEDVIASINIHRGPDTKSALQGMFKAIKDVAADGNAITIKLNGPNADFPLLLTDPRMNIVPVVDGRPDLVHGIGTGIYKVKNFEPGVRVTLERHANAWQADQFGFVESAELLGVSDPTARQNALAAGDVHAINRPNLNTVKLLAGRPHIELISVPSTFLYTSPMMSDVEPFSNNDFRLAVKYGIDRQGFLDRIVYGYGTLGNDQPIGPGFQYHADDITQHHHDPDKARFHLKKSGHQNITVDYSAVDAAYVGAVNFAALMKESLAPIGININIVREPNDGYWSNVWNKKPWCAAYWGPRPVADMILSICYLSDANWNDTRWGTPQLDKLIIAARGELDSGKRAETYREVQQIISQNGATLIPANGVNVAATSDKVGTSGHYSGRDWEMDGCAFVKRWWLKS